MALIKESERRQGVMIDHILSFIAKVDLFDKNELANIGETLRVLRSDNTFTFEEAHVIGAALELIESKRIEL